MHLQTDRLILRPFEAGDLKPFSHINADPEVMRFFSAPQTSEETAQMLAKWADKQTRYGYGFAAVETRRSLLDTIANHEKAAAFKEILANHG